MRLQPTTEFFSVDATRVASRCSVRLTPKGGRDAIDGRRTARRRPALCSRRGCGRRRPRGRRMRHSSACSPGLVKGRAPAGQSGGGGDGNGSSGCRIDGEAQGVGCCGHGRHRGRRTKTMSATLIDGKGHRGGSLRDDIARRRLCRSVRAEGFGTGACRGPGRQPSGQRILCALASPTKSLPAGMRSFDHRLPEADQPGRPSVADRQPQRRSGGSWHPGAIAIAGRQIDPEADHQRRSTPAKDVDGLHPLNAGLPGERPDRRWSPCTAARLHHPGQDRPCLARRSGHGGDRPLEAGRQARRPASPGRERHRHAGPFQDPRPSRLSAVAPIFSSRRSAVPLMVRGDWIKPGSTVIDVGINRVRRPTTARVGIVGDVAFAEATPNRRRHHSGAGRRRTDDHCVSAAQHT